MPRRALPIPRQPFEPTMTMRTACALATLLAMPVAFGAPPKSISVDKSASFLVDEATTEKLWNESLPARVKKLYPVNRWRFVSDVGGGFTESKTCVVTARAMLLPMRGKTVVFAPEKSATAFDAVPNLSKEQCQELARTKLTEAIGAVAAALVKN